MTLSFQGIIQKNSDAIWFFNKSLTALCYAKVSFSSYELESHCEMHFENRVVQKVKQTWKSLSPSSPDKFQKFYNVYFQQSYRLDAHLVCKKLQRSVEQGAGNVRRLTFF